MIPELKHWLVLYDIRDAKRLGKTAKILENFGVRVQQSVFELYADAAVIQQIRSMLYDIVDLEEDSILYFELCERDWQKQIKIGVGRKIDAEEDDFLII